MAVLPILKYPDPRLNRVAKPVREVDDRIRQLVRDMAETMYAAPGIGLAATQVDVHERVIVIDVSEARDELRVFINPEIVGESLDRKVYEEGCLSIPEQYADVTRPAEVKVRWLGLDGKTHERDFEGLWATCVQHEIDHLDGVLFIDHISKLKRDMVMRRFKKLSKDKPPSRLAV